MVKSNKRRFGQITARSRCIAAVATTWNETCSFLWGGRVKKAESYVCTRMVRPQNEEGNARTAMTAACGWWLNTERWRLILMRKAIWSHLKAPEPLQTFQIALKRCWYTQSFRMEITSLKSQSRLWYLIWAGIIQSLKTFNFTFRDICTKKSGSVAKKNVLGFKKCEQVWINAQTPMVYKT